MRKSRKMTCHSIREIEEKELLLDFIEKQMKKSDPAFDYFMALLEEEDEEDGKL